MLSRVIFLFEVLLTNIAGLIFSNNFNKKIYKFNFPEVWYSPWNNDVEFISIYKKISKNTLVSKRKVYDLFCISKQLNNLNGAYMEIGTLRGGTAALLASHYTGPKIILWDNWGKSVEYDDYFLKKTYSVGDDLKKTQELLHDVCPIALAKCDFINQTFPQKDIIEELKIPLSLVHFDIYDKSAFEFGIELIWPKIVVGGIFIVSAYGSISLDPLTRAVNNFFQKTNDCFFIQSQSGLALLVKLNNASPPRESNSA